MNLFQKAKTKETPKAKKKDEKVIVTIDNSDFYDKVEELQILQDRQKRDKAKADLLSDDVKTTSKSEWLKLYKSTGKNPDTILIQAEGEGGTVASVMFCPTDKYITISPERADELKEKYEDIVDEKTVFTFNNDMLDKYGEVLSRMIMESSDIRDEDKAKIIESSTSFSIKKGSIDNMNKWGDVEEICEEIRPVVALKNIEIIKS
jgi:hypothetical protein